MRTDGTTMIDQPACSRTFCSPSWNQHNAQVLITCVCPHPLLYTWVQKKLEDLEDAGNELMLCDDESIRYVAGECFVHMGKESAEERLQKLSDSVNEDVASHEAQVEEIQAKMKELKTVLYGKFGNSINL